MRIVFVSLFRACPPTNGAAMVTHNCARYAHGERVLIQLCEGAAEQEQQTEGVRVISLPGVHGRLRRLALLPRRLRQIAARCRQLSPDLVVLEGANWVGYLWLLHRYLRLEQVTAPVAYHAHNVEQLFRRDQYGRVVGAVTAVAEGHLARRADYVFAVSEVDREHFRHLYGIQPHLLYNGVDAARFDSVQPEHIRAIRNRYCLPSKAVVFIGPYFYPPNREAIDFLVNSAFPLVHSHCPEAALAVLGGPIPYTRPWLIAPGSIPAEDMPAFLSACRVGVAPIFSGGGTRLKILEYLMAGLPTVATRKGAEGLAVAEGREILYAHQPAEFADQILRLLGDQALAASLATCGRQRVRDRYAWTRIMSDFQQVVDAGRAQGGHQLW